MRQLEHLHFVLSRWPRASVALGFLVAIVLGGTNLAWGDRLPPSPVEELRQALRVDKDAIRSESYKEFRKTTLETRVNAVKSLGDLSQGLLLSDWTDASDVYRELSPIDAAARGRLAERFISEVRRVLKSGDPTSRAAAAGLVGDTATLARERDTESPAVLHALEELAKDLVQATHDSEERVRLQAIRSLGRIQSKARFKLTDATLASLRGEGVPESVLSKLNDLKEKKDQEVDRERFLQELDKALNKDELNRYRQQILNHASKAASILVPLGELFAGSSLADRRAAAGALASLVRILPEVKKTFSLATGVTAAGPAIEREDRIQISQGIIAAARKGLADADVEVRRLCADALFQTALLLSDSPDLIAPVRSDIPLPPPGRPVSEAEAKEIDRLRASVNAEREQLAPLLTAFHDLAPALASHASDKDPAVRILVIRTLEEMGNARQKLLLREASVPKYEAKPGGKKNDDRKKDDEKKNGDPKKDGGDEEDDGKKYGNDDARLDSADAIQYAAANVQPLPQFRLEGKDLLLEGLTKTETLHALEDALADSKAEVRLAAVDTLETLGDDAAPAAPHLAWALTDPDRFVRWAAARTLGRMRPQKANADKVVPNLIRMLDDPDLDLRLIAAQSLERYGPVAKASVPALAKSTANGDPEIRRAAIRALLGVGTEAKPAIPDIAAALSNPDVRVRRTAAEALARFGALSKPAEAALRKALDDNDAEVRRYAADTLLQFK
jgi:HEAT repeat protein